MFLNVFNKSTFENNFLLQNVELLYLFTQPKNSVKDFLYSYKRLCGLVPNLIQVKLNPYHQDMFTALNHLDFLSLSVPIFHCFWLIHKTASCLRTEYVSFCWSANTGVSMCRSTLNNVAYEFDHVSSVVLSMSCLSYLNDLYDRR